MECPFTQGDYICKINRPDKIYQVKAGEEKYYGYKLVKAYVVSKKTGKTSGCTSIDIYNYSYNQYQITENIYAPEFKTMATTKTVLYSFVVDGKERYGSHIGTNSSNQYLIEEKTTGQIHVLNKEDLTEVLPYTFSVQYHGNVPNGIPTEFIGKPDNLKKGDLLIFTRRDAMYFCSVKELDTKSRSATANFTGRKLVTEAV